MRSKFIVASLIILAVFVKDAQAQPGTGHGMDYNGPVAFHWSGLRDPGGSFFVRFFQDEKALGVYQTKSILPVSFLTVNTNATHMPFPMPGLGLGEVFSSDASGTVPSSFWRMRRGGVEYGLLFDLNTDFNLQASQRKMWFLTRQGAPVQQRMLVDDVSTNGSIGMGDNLPALFFPQSRLHIDVSTANPSDMRFTNLSSGNTFTDGFRIGLNPAGLSAGLAMLEPLGDMRFQTGGFSRMGIIANGRTVVSPNIVPLLPFLTNRFTIDADPTDATPSGLRLFDLPCTAPTVPQCNPAAPVFLSVDAFGNVILVGSPGGLITGADNGLTVSSSGIVQLGNGLCNGTGLFTSNREIPMNNFNLYFNDVASNTGSLYLGTNNSCGPILSRFDIINDSKIVAAYFQTTLGTGAGIAGMRGVSNNTATTGASIGVSGVSSTLGGTTIGIQGISQGGNLGFTSFSIGVAGQSFNPSGTSTQVIGVNGVSRNGTNYSIAGNFDVINSTSPQNYGLQVEVQGGTIPGSINYGGQVIVSNVGSVNYGAQFLVSGGTTNNYGIFASVPTPTSGGAGPDYAAFLNGDLVTTASGFVPSDKRLKKDIVTIENSLSVIKKLNPVTYTFDQANHLNINLGKGQQYGFISQEVKKILPDLTAPVVMPAMYDSQGKETSPKEEYLGMNYMGFIAILTKGMQEQQHMIETQQQQIDELKALVGNSPALQNNGSNKSQTSVVLSDKNVVVLNQNTPNPFAEQTVITYNLPDNTGFAQIIFYNNVGQLIKVVDIKEKGKGQLNVFADDLSNGIYTYSLVVDGKVIDSKKMTKTE